MYISVSWCQNRVCCRTPSTNGLRAATTLYRGFIYMKEATPPSEKLLRPDGLTPVGVTFELLTLKVQNYLHARLTDYRQL